jgi:hypothetical protein
MGPEEKFWVGVSYVVKVKCKFHPRTDHEGADGWADL